MAKRSMFVGMDVHKESIDISLAEERRDGEVRHYGVIQQRLDAIAILADRRKLPRQLPLHFGLRRRDVHTDPPEHRRRLRSGRRRQYQALVMELVEGQHWPTASPSVRFPLMRLLIANQIAEALEAAHPPDPTPAAGR